MAVKPNIVEDVILKVKASLENKAIVSSSLLHMILLYIINYYYRQRDI